MPLIFWGCRFRLRRISLSRCGEMGVVDAYGLGSRLRNLAMDPNRAQLVWYRQMHRRRPFDFLLCLIGLLSNPATTMVSTQA